MGIASILTTLSDVVNSSTKKSISSFSFLETTDDEYTVVGKDGSLMSLIKIDGVRQVMGTDELNRTIERLSSSLSSILGRPGYAIQVWFTRDPDLSAQMIKTQMVPPRRIAKALKLQLDDLFDERERHLPNFVVYESFHIALWTRLSVMTKDERAKAKIDSKPPKLFPTLSDTQDLFRVAKPLRDRHRSFVKNFTSDLRAVDIRSKVMTAHEAIKAVKSSIYPDLVGADWKPTLPGDKTPMREPEINDVDRSHLLWPRVDDQIFHQEAERINPRIVRVGSRLFAGVDMTIGPQDPLPFSHLLGRMLDIGEFPWRASFLIEGGGLQNLGIKSFLAAIFTPTNGENRAIRDAIKALQEARTMDNSVVTKLRVSFATWAPADSLALAEERSSRLQRAVESWGYCMVSASAGDPLAGALSSALALSPSSTAPAGAVPLSDVIGMLPLDRDASPWSSGPIMFRTPDGRIWPYTPGSSQQDAFIDLIFAPPGKGKSVYLNTANLALSLSPLATYGVGGVMLPQIAIIDIGPSSSGFISLLKEALPPERRHEAQYRRLKNHKDHSINPFDTQLGCRQAFPTEKAFLVNFLAALGTPPGDVSPPEGLSEMASFCVDELYGMFSDENPKSSPKKYIAGEDVVVDNAISKHDIHYTSDTNWWDLVDALFERGDTHAASVAQRYAVPKLEDLGLVLNTKAIADVFESARSASTEKTIDAFRRMLMSSLREYPILTTETRFDLGTARVVALDLDEVAPRGGGPAAKQTSLMYMLARFVLAKDFFLNEDLLTATSAYGRMIPSLFQQYHASRIRRIREVPKRLVYDEFHRTSGSKAVREQVMVDIREGRKWGVHIALASQLLGDFDKDMVDLASGVWIMGVGPERAADEAAKLFKLSETAREIMRRRLTGPSESGAPFLAVLYLKDGTHEHLLVNTLGPTELWAFSTTAQDSSLRNRLYALLGATEARQVLVDRFPNGSALREIERRLQVMQESGHSIDEAEDGIIDGLSKELVEIHRARMEHRSQRSVRQ